MGTDKERASDYSSYHTWTEIFTMPEDREKQFQAYIDESITAYKEDGTFDKVITDIDPKTGLRKITIQRTPLTLRCVIEELENGNLRETFQSEGQHAVQLIEPSIGSRNHRWTWELINQLEAKARLMLHNRAVDPDKAYDVVMSLFALRGKPACQEWEDLMIENEEYPCRIGFKIYSAQRLERADLIITT